MCCIGGKPYRCADSLASIAENKTLHTIFYSPLPGAAWHSCVHVRVCLYIDDVFISNLKMLRDQIANNEETNSNSNSNNNAKNQYGNLLEFYGFACVDVVCVRDADKCCQ